MKQGRDVSRETGEGMFHVKRSREGGDVSRETKEGGVPVFGGGLPSLPPADLAFSLLFCPHPPAPFPAGRGRFFALFCRGLAPPAPLRLSPRGTGYTFGTQPLKHYRKHPCQCIFMKVLGGSGDSFKSPPTHPFPQKVGIRGGESFEMLLQRKGKCGIL